MASRFLFTMLSVFTILGCSTDKLDVDVSDVELEMSFERFEEQMFIAQSPSEMTEINAELIEKGGELYEFYVYEMLRSGSVYDDSIGDYLYYFVSDSIMKMAAQDIKGEFGDFESDQESILEMFKRLKYHLPNAPLPDGLITYNSAFNYGVISTDKKIGLGLDMYLGELNRLIAELGFPVYMKEKMSHEYMLADIAHSWLATNVLGDPTSETFLSKMIYYGKLRYFIDAMNPNLADHLKIRYSEEEFDFCVASEYDVWQYLLDMDWMYSTDMKVSLRFFEESPTTVGIEGSPGRLGQFMGWRMVQQYMDKNEEVTLEELLNETEESKFLKTYKPEDE
jgi:hypothetical protein